MAQVQSEPVLRQAVLDVLADPLLKVFNFRLEGFPVIDWRLFREVRDHIDRCDIPVVVPNPKSQLRDAHAQGGYSSSADQLSLPFGKKLIETTPKASRPVLQSAEKAVIAHEAVHAGFDIKKVKGALADTEVCGYVVEGVVIISLMPIAVRQRWKPSSPLGELTQRVFRELVSPTATPRRSTPFVIKRTDKDFQETRTHLLAGFKRRLDNSKFRADVDDAMQRQVNSEFRRTGVPRIGQCGF